MKLAASVESEGEVTPLIMHGRGRVAVVFRGRPREHGECASVEGDIDFLAGISE